MELGTLLPWSDIGGELAVIREYAQAAESIGYDFLEAPDHVLGVNAASRPGWDRNDNNDLFHDPFVLFGYLAGCTTKLGFSTGVLILPQRQTVLVAKQAACLDVLSRWAVPARDRGRLERGRVHRAQREFSQPRSPLGGAGGSHAGTVGRAACELKGSWHTIEDAGINPRPHRARCRCGSAGITIAPWQDRQMGRRLDAERLSARPRSHRSAGPVASDDRGRRPQSGANRDRGLGVDGDPSEADWAKEARFWKQAGARISA